MAAMDPYITIIVSKTVYKLACLCVGSIFCYLGYKLFRLGIWGKAGNMQANFNDFKLVLRSAAPGTFFALFGAVIVVVTLLHDDLNFDYRKNSSQNEQQDDSSPELP